MARRIKRALVVGLAALFLNIAEPKAQDTTEAIFEDYIQRFNLIEQQTDDLEQMISEASNIITRFASDSRLTEDQRVELESAMRCTTTAMLDQLNGISIVANAESYQRAENILNLDVVITESANSETEASYAFQAAECLWVRSGDLERIGRQSNIELPHIQIAYDNASLRYAAKSMDLYLLAAATISRLYPGDTEFQIRTRSQISLRYFEYAAVARRLSGPFVSTSHILDAANEYGNALLLDLADFSDGPNQAWVNAKTTQIQGNLINGESERAAESAVELVVFVGETQREAATNYVIGLVEHEAALNPTYRQHLDRLFAERGW